MKLTWIVIVMIALLLVSLLIGCTAQDPESPSAGSSYTWDGEITTKTEPEADMKKATLSFDSFDGGGPSFSATADDPSILSWTQKSKYHDPNHEKMNGAGFTVTFTFTGTAGQHNAPDRRALSHRRKLRPYLRRHGSGGPFRIAGVDGNQGFEQSCRGACPHASNRGG